MTPLTILSGSTFCISDEFGDIADEAAGFFAEDVRYLSLLRVRINDERPLLLTSGRLEHFTAVDRFHGIVPHSLLVPTLCVGTTLRPLCGHGAP